MSIEPTVDLPELPEGYIQEPGTFMTWIEVEARLAESAHYWLSTTRPDGRPHVMPRWGVWLDGALWYDGSPATRHAQNLARNPSCTLHLESGKTVTIVEGTSRVPEPVVGQLGERLAAEYGRKYGPMYTPAPDAWAGKESGGLLVFRPEKAIAWTSFPADVTRFTFADVT